MNIEEIRDLQANAEKLERQATDLKSNGELTDVYENRIESGKGRNKETRILEKSKITTTVKDSRIVIGQKDLMDRHSFSMHEKSELDLHDDQAKALRDILNILYPKEPLMWHKKGE